VKGSVKLDVLVIGGGIAGLMAAVAAKERSPDADVLLLDKCVAGKSGSSVQAKGLAAVGRWSFPQDAKEKHLEDSIRAGCGLNVRSLTERVVCEIEGVVDRLEAWGMRFDPKDPALYSGPETPSAGHRHYRYVNLKDGTGKVLQDVLRRRAQATGVTIVNGMQVVELVAPDQVCGGAIAWDFVRGRHVPFAAASVVIATGGAGYLFLRTSNPPQVMGDGLWLAYQAGAELSDLEMVQFYPVNYVHPRALEGKNVGSYGEARLYNTLGERFMERYDAVNLENTTRDCLSQAVYLEIYEGRGTEHGGVVIDRTGLPAAYYEQFPVERQTTLDGGLDITRETGEVSPAAHYLMGGIRVDRDCRSTLPGLYAAGEAAAGVHGANRLANNSLSDTLVLGQIAGEAASEVANRGRRSPAPAFDARMSAQSERVREWGANRSRESVFPLIRATRTRMWNLVGVVRTESALEAACRELSDLRRAARERAGLRSAGLGCNPELVALYEAEAMAGVGELMARSALMRTESRGAHYRSDHPDRDDAHWEKNIIVRRGPDGGAEIDAVPCVEVPRRGQDG